MSLLKKDNSMPALSISRDLPYKKLGGGFSIHSRIKNSSNSPQYQSISRNQGTIVRHTHSHAQLPQNKEMEFQTIPALDTK